MLKLAEHILESKEADFDPSQFVDHYEEAVVDILKKKQAGIPATREHATPRPQNVVNLMDALRCSIEQDKRALGGAAVNYAFIEHFQEVARGHFTVRRLERVYGKNVVRTEYERLAQDH